MRLALPVCAALLVLPLLAGADELPTETVIRLKVRPAAAPRPALRYQLLPELQEMEPGNAILGYLKCFMEQQHFFSKEAAEQREKWLEMPLQDLPLKEIRAAGYRKDINPLKQADQAARLDHADWQTLVPLRKEGIYLLLPEVQGMRVLAGALLLRLRADVAEGHFDDALASTKTMLALARHMSEDPTLISDLVGIAIAGMTIEPLNEMVAQPGCPNLYWALTDLPDPLINLRRGLQAERTFLNSLFAGVDASQPMTEQQLRQAMDTITRLVPEMAGPNKRSPAQRDPRRWLTARAEDEALVRAARRALVASGLPEQRVKQFPPLQVILLEARLAHDTERDDAFKALGLPYWQGKDAFAPGKNPPDDLLFGRMLGTGMKLLMAQTRSQQRIGLLRCVEALRMYAAEHQGRLPARLEDLKVPVPIDPVTGRAFVYRLEGDTATIRGTPPGGMEKRAESNVRDEVTIGK